MEESNADQGTGAGAGRPGRLSASGFESVYVKGLVPVRQKSIDQRRKLRNIYYPKFKTAAGKLVERETADIRAVLASSIGRNAGAIESWLVTYYSNLPAMAKQEFLGLLSVYAGEVIRIAGPEAGLPADTSPEMQRFVSEYFSNFAKKYAGSSEGQLKEILKESDSETLPEMVNARLDEWDERRAEKVAGREVVEAEGAFTRKIYVLAGVTKLVWVSQGESCPFCQSLDGQVVGIMKSFVRDGDELPGSEDGDSMYVQGDKMHPPLHQGCDCTISIGF